MIHTSDIPLLCAVIIPLVIESFIIYKNINWGNKRLVLLGIIVFTIVVAHPLGIKFLFADIIGAIGIIVCYIISAVNKNKDKKMEIKEKETKLKKTISESLMNKKEIIEVLKIDDNISALAKCASLFEKDIINKTELEELEEYIKSRV